MASTDAGRSVLVGMVVTPDGWPVPHAMVTVVDETGRQSGRGAVDHDGRFTVEGLPPGAHTVITAAAGHAPQARRPRPGRHHRHRSRLPAALTPAVRARDERAARKAVRRAASY